MSFADNAIGHAAYFKGIHTVARHRKRRDKIAIPIDEPPISAWVMSIADDEFKDEQSKFGLGCFSETMLLATQITGVN